MSAATALALDKKPRRLFSRHPINVRLDLIALRSGVPENLPGRCTDISESGVGAVVAGELSNGQQVAIELRLPNFGVPVRARALLRHQSRLRCGFEFIGLSVEQREMIRYWVYRSAAQSDGLKDFKKDFVYLKREARGAAAMSDTAFASARPASQRRRRIRIGRRGFYVLIACMLALAGLGWWQWQSSWNELEKGAPAARGESRFRVSPETMGKRIIAKVDPIYPEAARRTKTEGLVVLDAVIAPDGTVKTLRPVSGSDLLVQSTTDAVQSWKFEPYFSRGRPVEVETTIAVEYRLN